MIEQQQDKVVEARSATKGLPFMALQFNVLYKRRQLAVTKQVTPAEYYLLEEIEIGTIGARNSRSQICSKAEFYLEDLSRNLGYKKVDKLWTLLNSLVAKKLILREKTRDKKKEILGLDPVAFGQVLIDTHHAIEKKRHLKLVDNSPEPVDNSKDEPTDHRDSTDESSVDNIQSIGTEPTNRRETQSQINETIGENPLLDSSRFNLDTLRGQTGSYTPSGKREQDWTKEMTPYEIEQKRQLLLRQIQEMKEQESRQA